MPVSYAITIDGFTFNVISGCGFEDGISIRPDIADLDNPKYIKALKRAIQAQPYLYARDYLDECVIKNRHGEHQNMPDSFLEQCKEYAELLIEPDCIIAVGPEIKHAIAWILVEHDRRANYVPPTPNPNSKRERIATRDGRRCRYCGKPVEFFHLDHVIPKSKGGNSSMSNLVVACPSCNSKKGAKTPEEAGMELMPL